MTPNFFSIKLVKIVIYAVVVGVTIQAFALAWRFLWNVETSARERGALAGAVIAFLVIWGIDKGPYFAGGIAAILVAGYFVGKLITKQFTG